MKNFLKGFVACAAIVFGLAACSGNGSSVSSLKLNRNTMTLAVGGEGLLVADDVPAQNVIWISNNSNIASVDNGKVYGAAEGMATITVTSQNGKGIDKCYVFVVPVENTYTVIFHSGKGNANTFSYWEELEGNPDQTFAYGLSEKLLPNGFDGAANGYEFIGWARGDTSSWFRLGPRQYDDGENVCLLKKNEGSVNHTEILYAKWKRKNQYAIRYHDMYDGYITQGDDVFDYGEGTVKLPANTEGSNVVIRPGYTFIGWSNGNEIITEISCNQQRDVDVYAQWTKKTYIDEDPYDDFRYISLNRKRIVLAVGEEIVLVPTGHPTTLENKGLVWASDDVTIVKVDENGRLTAISAGSTTITVTTLDGAIVANCDISVYDRNETFEVRYSGGYCGIGEMNDQTICDGDNLLPNAFTRAGYQFIGWANESGFPNRYDDCEYFRRYIYRDNSYNGAFEYSNNRTGRLRINLYAKWRKLDSEYAIFYRNLCDGYLPSGTPDTFTKDSETFALAEPSRPGYTFDGWYTQSNMQNNEMIVSGEKVTEIPKGTAQDYKLYAKWIPNNIAISLDVTQYSDLAGTLYCTRSGDNVTFTADSGKEKYEWWRNGEKLSESGSSLTFDTSSLPAGAYTITVVMDNAYSASYVLDLKK